MDVSSENSLELFLSIGLEEKTARETAESRFGTDLTALIHQAGITDGCERTIGNLLYMIATKYKGKALVHRPTLLIYIVSSKIKTSDQLDAAYSFLGTVGLEDLKLNELEEACGVGFADNDKPTKKEKKKKEKSSKVEKAVVEAVPHPSDEELNPYSIFPHPKQNFTVHTEVFFSDGSLLRCSNTKEMLDKHLKVTGGKVYTRFPPEPNGYLHIGHAKAMFVDFGLAKDRGGCCYLRYDNTNPEAEKKEYIDHIGEIVNWMGWEPFKITYTSDYFQELYDLAVELIRRGHAYVDHENAEEIKDYREKKMDSPWRDRPIEESIKLFDEMRRGMIEEGKATLRMKQDMQNDNCNM